MIGTKREQDGKIRAMALNEIIVQWTVRMGG